MTLTLTLLLALALGFGSHAEDPSPKLLTCPTCEGQGSALQDCVLCVAGDLRCRNCSSDKLARTLEPLFARGEGALAGDFLRLYDGRRLAAAMESALGIVRAEDGLFPCPAQCEGGVSSSNNKKCKYCKGVGRFKCSSCPRAVTLQRCVACEGKGSVRRLCENCLGAGQLPDPTECEGADAEHCDWCDSRATRACIECAPDGKSLRACALCLGEKTIQCHVCLGTSDKPCESCYGTGKAVRKGGKGVKPCRRCKRKGKLKCPECDDGRLECPECQGAGEYRQACVYCLGNRIRPCAGCFRGQYRHWEISAQLCEVAGDFERATRALEYAIERTQLRYSISVEWLVGDEAAKKLAKAKLEAQRKAERKRLEQQLDALRSRTE